jgi:hypothetical protein
MMVLKVRKSWNHVGAMPLLRALVLDGAIYYCVFLFAFLVEVLASTSREVGMLHLSRV